jgi:glycosyltransferase involved in cell wall biosynthesis
MQSKSPNDLSKYDVTTRQQAVLDYVLQEGGVGEPMIEDRVSVADARDGAMQLEISTDRNTTRLLFISRDTSLLNQTKQSLDGYLNLSDVFDEVHIVILQPGILTKNPVLRVADNVWLYVASAKHAWLTPIVALELIKNHLFFAGGFRPDLIVARDPFECALVAYLVGRWYDRPTQVHVLVDFLSPATPEKESLAWWQKRLAHVLVPRFQSIRTNTDQLLQKITKKFPHSIDAATLPRFRDVRPVSDISVATIKNIYRQFSVIVLYVGDFSHGGLAYQAIDMSRELLRNPRVGLVMIGDGPTRNECIKRAELMGYKTQVVFEKRVDDIALYLHTADMLIVPDTTTEGDEVVMQAAAYGLPMVVAQTPLRADLFIDGESAFLFEAKNISEAAGKLGRLLNENNLRHIFSEAVHEIAETRLHDDPVVYREAFRASIEEAILVAAEQS